LNVHAWHFSPDQRDIVIHMRVRETRNPCHG
jgi:hypothetical protein